MYARPLKLLGPMASRNASASRLAALPLTAVAHNRALWPALDTQLVRTAAMRRLNSAALLAVADLYALARARDDTRVLEIRVLVTSPWPAAGVESRGR